MTRIVEIEIRTNGTTRTYPRGGRISTLFPVQHQNREGIVAGFQSLGYSVAIETSDEDGTARVIMVKEELDNATNN